ncbi:hypothetical protein [Nocardia nova]|uniref:hypothetical protein n=1 Tax=Nocardia nova TaxID=37330 RepID=UPI003400448A
MSPNNFDELGLKVQRAQRAVEQIRGTGTVNGIRVVVDASGQLISVTGPEGNTILAAYQAAIEDMRPQLDEATHELRNDSRFEAVSTFTEANSTVQEADSFEQELSDDEDDDDYYARRNQQGWFEEA